MTGALRPVDPDCLLQDPGRFKFDARPFCGIVEIGQQPRCSGEAT